MEVVDVPLPHLSVRPRDLDKTAHGVVFVGISGAAVLFLIILLRQADTDQVSQGIVPPPLPSPVRIDAQVPIVVKVVPVLDARPVLRFGTVEVGIDFL